MLNDSRTRANVDLSTSKGVWFQAQDGSIYHLEDCIYGIKQDGTRIILKYHHHGNMGEQELYDFSKCDYTLRPTADEEIKRIMETIMMDITNGVVGLSIPKLLGDFTAFTDTTKTLIRSATKDVIDGVMLRLDGLDAKVAKALENWHEEPTDEKS